MKIRAATPNDADAVRRLHLSAFPEGESNLVAQLAMDLLTEESSPPILSVVSEVDGIVVGHVAFSPVTARDTKEHLGHILAPLAVSPDFRHRGIASQLIRSGIERLSGSGAKVLFVYGDPEFYGRFGFSAEHAARYAPPYQLQYDFGWQAMTLEDQGTDPSTVAISCVRSLGNPALW